MRAPVPDYEKVREHPDHPPQEKPTLPPLERYASRSGMRNLAAMPNPEFDTSGATFMHAGVAYRCLLVVSTRPRLALFECNACTAVVTDPARHGPACRRPKVRGSGVAVTIPLPGRPR